MILAERERAGHNPGTLLCQARVMAAGHGGQILLAESTASLLIGIDLVDLGPRRLRDLLTQVEMFQVRAVGLRTQFPPLRALDDRLGAAALRRWGYAASARACSASADVYFGFQPNCDFALLVSITTDARATCSHSRADGTNGSHGACRVDARRDF